MNTLQTRHAALLALLIVGGLAFLVGDLHRVIIRAVWPFIETFWDTYIGLELWP
jgi:hypothetical protein